MKDCLSCGIKLKDYRSKRCRSCSKLGKNNSMTGVYGKNHPRYKGGWINQRSGYRFIRENNRVYYFHRYVMEKHLGRKLRTTEVVHHKNGNKLDNRIENLDLITQSKHVGLHKPMLGKKSKVLRDPITQRFINN